jgi:hypothetical protein
MRERRENERERERERVCVCVRETEIEWEREKCAQQCSYECLKLVSVNVSKDCSKKFQELKFNGWTLLSKLQ